MGDLGGLGRQGSGSFNYEKTKAPHSGNIGIVVNRREMWLTKKMQSDDGWGTGMESYRLYWKRQDGILYVPKSRPLCNDLGGSASSALSGLYIRARLFLQVLFSFT